MSDTTALRPGWQRLLRALGSRGPVPWEAVIADDASRIDRGGALAQVAQLFAARNVALIAADSGRDLSSEDERLLVHVSAGLSEHYVAELARRTRAGLRERAAAGC